MDEKQLIEKLQTLKQIKPKSDWAILAKNRILSEDIFISNRVKGVGIWKEINFIFNHKYAFATLIAMFAIMGTFGFALKSTPGDTLFALKKAMEESQGVFVSESEKQKFELEQANKRLEDLVKIASNKDSRKLAPAIDEYKATVSEVAKNLAGEKDNEKIKELVAEVKKLENKEKEITSLGVELGENPDKDIVLVQLIAKQVMNLEAEKLNEEQKEILSEIKSDCEEGKFVEALEKILVINANKNIEE